jgi:hypothetical protein
MARVYFKNWDWTHVEEDDESLRNEGFEVRYVSPGEYAWRRDRICEREGLPKGSAVEVIGGE